jgi:hypothetical protein
VNLAALLEAWVAKYDVETVLERIVGPGASPACAALAARGKRVVAVVDDRSSASGVRAAYGASAEVRVAGGDPAELPKSDLVLVHGARIEGDWRAALTELGAHATKLVVVVVENPGAWPARARSLLARVTGENGAGHDPASEGWGRTAALAPVLWAIGRVRDHAYLDVPPLGVRAPRLAARVAPLHAFVVDVTPRTPQARRKLRLAKEA